MKMNLSKKRKQIIGEMLAKRRKGGKNKGKSFANITTKNLWSRKEEAYNEC